MKSDLEASASPTYALLAPTTIVKLLRVMKSIHLLAFTTLQLSPIEQNLPSLHLDVRSDVICLTVFAVVRIRVFGLNRKTTLKLGPDLRIPGSGPGGHGGSRAGA